MNDDERWFDLLNRRFSDGTSVEIVAKSILTDAYTVAAMLVRQCRSIDEAVAVLEARARGESGWPRPPYRS